MGREIKFRGVNPYNKKVMGVSVIDWMHDEVYFDRGSDVSYPTNESSLMQYTGLKDRNGVEIYEGDIVNFLCDGERLNFVISMIKGGCFAAHRKSNTSDFYFLDDFNYLVIGNVYENPELINP